MPFVRLDRPALRFAGVYALLGGAWVLFSDSLILEVAPHLRVFAQLGMWKGMVLVLTTAFVLYLALRRQGKGSSQVLDEEGTITGIQTLIAVFVLLVAVIALIGLGGVAYSASRHKDAEVRRLQAIADLKAGQIVTWLEERYANGESLRADDSLAELYSHWRQTGDDRSRKKLVKRLEGYRDVSRYIRVLLLDQHGDIVFSTDDGHPPSPRLQETVRRAIAEGRVLATDLYRTKEGDTDEVHLEFVVPLPVARGQAGLAVVLDTDPNTFLFPFVQSWPVPSPSAETMLFRRDGDDVLYLNELRHRHGTALRLRIPLSQERMLTAQVLDQRGQSGVAVEGLDYRDAPTLGVARAIPGTSWYLLAKLDQDEVFAEARQDARWIALADLLALVIAAVVVVLVHQRRELRFSLIQRRQQEEKMQALQLLDAVAQGSSDAIFAKDAAGRYMLANEAAASFMGRPPEAVLGLDDGAFFPEDEASVIRAGDRRVMAENRLSNGEEVITTRKGVVTFLVTKGPLHDGNGKVVGVFGIARDISERKRLEARWRESEARFRALAALSSDWYWEQDAEFRFVSYSDAFADKMPLRDQADMMGKRRWELPTIGITDEQWAAHRDQLARQEPFRDLEYGWMTRDGRRCYVNVSGEPIFAADGRFTGYRGVARDITARKRSDEELRQSEARLAGTIASALDAILTLDQQQRITIFNPAAEAIFGYRAEDVLHRQADILFPAALRQDWSGTDAGIMERCLAETDARLNRYTLRGRRKDGVELILEASISCHRVGQESLQTLILRDITFHLAVERRLSQLSAAVDQSPVAIVITDLAGRIEYVNPRFSEISGYSFDEVLERTPRILKSGNMPRAEYERLWRTISSGGEWSGELHNRKKNGELFWEFARIMPIVAKDGTIVNYMAVKEDITQRKENERRERLRQEQMLHSARLVSMGEMAAALAHELNQPLTAIANFGSVAERQLTGPVPDTDAALQVLRLIIGQALRAGQIVWRIRDFVNKRDPQRVAADLNRVILETVQLAEISLRDRSIPIELDLDPELPAVPVDRIQIEQVLFNLIKNGVEAMDESPEDRRLTIVTSRDTAGSQIRVEVQDRGCGLPNLIAVDIFAPFCTTKPQGMGMGLSICRGIVEAHGGSMWAERNKQVGSTFFFTLPMAKDSTNE